MSIDVKKLKSLCVECGPNVRVDEDGLCASCGGTAIGTWLDRQSDMTLMHDALTEANQKERTGRGELMDEITRLRAALREACDIASRIQSTGWREGDECIKRIAELRKQAEEAA
jgi:hypothetical protein